MHTYREVGTFTVTLTVNDGFGGISTAMASITVQDVPPAFVPNSFTPPVTFSAPTPGDGFGDVGGLGGRQCGDRCAV